VLLWLLSFDIDIHWLFVIIIIQSWRLCLLIVHSLFIVNLFYWWYCWYYCSWSIVNDYCYWWHYCVDPLMIVGIISFVIIVFDDMTVCPMIFGVFGIDIVWLLCWWLMTVLFDDIRVPLLIFIVLLTSIDIVMSTDVGDIRCCHYCRYWCWPAILFWYDTLLLSLMTYWYCSIYCIHSVFIDDIDVYSVLTICCYCCVIDLLLMYCIYSFLRIIVIIILTVSVFVCVCYYWWLLSVSVLLLCVIHYSMLFHCLLLCSIHYCVLFHYWYSDIRLCWWWSMLFNWYCSIGIPIDILFIIHDWHCWYCVPMTDIDPCTGNCSYYSSIPIDIHWYCLSSVLFIDRIDICFINVISSILLLLHSDIDLMILLILMCCYSQLYWLLLTSIIHWSDYSFHRYLMTDTLILCIDRWYSTIILMTQLMIHWYCCIHWLFWYSLMWWSDIIIIIRYYLLILILLFYSTLLSIFLLLFQLIFPKLLLMLFDIVMLMMTDDDDDYNHCYWCPSIYSNLFIVVDGYYSVVVFFWHWWNRYITNRWLRNTFMLAWLLFDAIWLFYGIYTNRWPLMSSIRSRWHWYSILIPDITVFISICWWHWCSYDDIPHSWLIDDVWCLLLISDDHCYIHYSIWWPILTSLTVIRYWCCYSIRYHWHSECLLCCVVVMTWPADISYWPVLTVIDIVVRRVSHDHVVLSLSVLLADYSLCYYSVLTWCLFLASVLLYQSVADYWWLRYSFIDILIDDIIDDGVGFIDDYCVLFDVIVGIDIVWYFRYYFVLYFRCLSWLFEKYDTADTLFSLVILMIILDDDSLLSMMILMNLDIPFALIDDDDRVFDDHLPFILTCCGDCIC